jgi:hypothetical protein
MKHARAWNRSMKLSAVAFSIAAAACTAANDGTPTPGAGGAPGNAGGGTRAGASGGANAGTTGGVSAGVSGGVSAGASGGVSAGAGGSAGAAATVGGGHAAPDGQGPAVIDSELGDPAKDSEQTWKVTVSGKMLDTWVWVPGGVSQLRGIIVNVQFGTHYKELARLMQFALMAFDPAQYHDVADWDVSFQLQAAKDAAERFGHPELADAPFVATGHSIASGSGGLFLLQQAPERLIAAGPGGMGYTYTYKNDHPIDVAKRVPFLLFRGGRPGDSGNGIPGDIEANRTIGGSFAYAVQWDAKHDIGLSPNIVIPLWWQALARRYPFGKAPAKGPVPLQAIPEEAGWLGSTDGWTADGASLTVPAHTVPTIAPFAAFTGDKRKAVWLLDSYVAHVWQAYEATDDTIRITTPPRMYKDAGGTGLALIEPGGKLDVAVESGETPSPVKKLQLYDGDLALASADGAKSTFAAIGFAPGVHALIAVATLADGNVLTSRPTVVLAIRGKCPAPNPKDNYPITCVKPR